jgi:hypothetical protein
LSNLHLYFYHASPGIVKFVQGQANLRDLGLVELTRKEMSSLILPSLRKVSFFAHWGEHGGIPIFFNSHPQIQHITIKSSFVNEPYPIQTKMASIFEGAINAKFLHIIPSQPEDLSVLFDLELGPVWNPSLRLIAISCFRAELDALSILFSMNTVVSFLYPAHICLILIRKILVTWMLSSPSRHDIQLRTTTSPDPGFNGIRAQF